MRSLLALLLLTFGLSCSDIGQDAADCVGADCGPELVDPLAVVDWPIDMGCEVSALPIRPPVLTWKLSVDPGPIVAGQPFGARIWGSIVVTEELLDEQQISFPGTSRNLNLETQATVRVRRGVTVEGEDLVREIVLTVEPPPWTCRYDEAGFKAGLGVFPGCDPVDDTEDGGNTGCTGLGGLPSPENPCARFTSLPISEDCSDGGECELRGKTDQCNDFDFCVNGALETPLRPRYAVFVADAEAESVLFGFDDEGTNAALGPDNTWSLPAFVFEDEVGSNGFRTLIDGDPNRGMVAFECVMGVGAVPVSVTPDSELIRFPIQ